MTWTDDFDRADGPVDNGWTDLGTACTISSGNPTSTGTAFIVRSFTGSSGVQTATCTFDYSTQSGWSSRPVVKCNEDGSEYYAAGINAPGSQSYGYIYKVTNGTPTAIGTSDYFSTASGSITVSLTYNAGALSMTVNGTQRATASDSAFGSNEYIGLYNPNLIIPTETYTDNGPEPPYLTIEPSEVWVANPINFLQATIHNADWSDVTDPGTGLTSDKGYCASSFLETDTIQAFSWVALLQTGTITITDPHTGASGTFTCTVYPPQNSGQSYPLTEDAAGILDRSGEACPEGHMLTTCDEVEAASGVTILKALDGILEQLGGFYGQVGPDIGTVSLPSEIKELFKKQGESGYWTVPELIELLAGSPTVYSHADLKLAIDNIQVGDNQDVLDALAAYFGANPPTIEQLGTMVSDLATIAGYDLGDVLDAIAAIPPTDLSAVTAKLDLIQPSTAADLTTITNQLTTIDGNVDDLENSLAAVRTVANLTLQDILDAIDALTVTAPPAPPVWPGVGNVTLGTPVALSDGLHIEGAMDGVIIAITTPPTKTGQRGFGGVIYYYGLGELAFETDDGDLEMWQYIGFTAMMATPKSMQHAGGVRVRMPSGGSGTITPWTAS